MDDLSGRGLGSGLGLGRVDQGPSFTTCSASRGARASRTRRVGRVAAAAADAADDDDAGADDAEFDAMQVLVLVLMYVRARVESQR